MTKKESGEKLGTLFAQDKGKEEQTDPHLILILKRLREKLDEWLKSINDRIESEDVSRLEVRFLEILRSILGWVREKVDAKIESYEKEKPTNREALLVNMVINRLSMVSLSVNTWEDSLSEDRSFNWKKKLMKFSFSKYC
jgi:hypothetical protein